jgi:hypothetical protein
MSLGDFWLAELELELHQAVNDRVLSPEQVSLLERRKAGDDYMLIRRRFTICNDEGVARAIVRTVLGFRWSRTMTGGPLAYLSNLDQSRFKRIVCDRAEDVNCVTKSDAIAIAFDLRETRILRAIQILAALKCQGLLERLAKIYPHQEADGKSIELLCEMTDIRICRPQTLELARRFFCDREKIANFLIRYEPLFQRDPRLMWNADETQLNSMKKFRVLCQKGMLPLLTAMQELPHITGLVSISGGGVVLKPVVILKSLQHLKSLVQFEPHCFFCTSTNGWITKTLWTYYALVFAAQMSEYRLTLPEEIRDEQMLLIVDGHKSRLNYEAAMIFAMSGIDVLVLPAHSSHLLQMFDVAVAAPLKVAFKQELDRRVQQFGEAFPGDMNKTQLLRQILVDSFINAVHRGATPANIVAGFQKTGIIPFNPMIPLESQYAMDPPNLRLFHTVRTGSEVNEMVLTFQEGLDFLCRREQGRSLRDDDYDLNLPAAWQKLTKSTVQDGLAISPPPSLFVRVDPQTIKQIDIRSINP